jgi:hypothetical protein
MFLRSIIGTYIWLISACSGSSTATSRSITPPAVKDIVTDMSCLKAGSVTPPRLGDGRGSRGARRIESPAPGIHLGSMDTSFERTETDASDDEPSLETILSQEFGIKKGARIAAMDNTKIRLGTVVGEGSFGVVFESQSRTDGSLVAVKFAPVDDNDIETEFRIMKDLENVSGVTRVMYLSDPFGNKDYQFRYMIMELLRGSPSDLADQVVRTHDVNEKENMVLEFALRALDILQQVHDMGYVHGDIHMDSFMYSATGELKLIDFGKSYKPFNMSETQSRPMLDYENSEWLISDSPGLLSYCELAGQHWGTWKDDLLRLGELLFRLYDQFAFLRIWKALVTYTLDINAPGHIDQLIKFKKGLSTLSLDYTGANSFLNRFQSAVSVLEIKERPASYSSLIGMPSDAPTEPTVAV